MKSTYFPTAEQAEADCKWFVVDATGKHLGRLASEIAAVIRGKNKVTFTPHNDCGDGVIVVNAEKVALSSGKLEKKVYYRHSQFIGGLKTTKASDMIQDNPERIIEYAVYGMLPKSRLGKRMEKKLKVYRGSVHPHSAQQPQEFKLRYC